MMVTAFHVAQRFLGFREVEGNTANPHILGMLQLDSSWPSDDAVPWCSAFVNYVCWLLSLPRSKSLRARSWLLIGKPVDVAEAVVGYDVVILQRGSGVQPDATVIDAAGHVGFFAGMDGSNILVLGGNQSNSVSVVAYSPDRLLGIRRLA